MQTTEHRLMRSVVYLIFLIIYLSVVFLMFRARNMAGYPVAVRQSLVVELLREASALTKKTHDSSGERPKITHAVELFAVEHQALAAAPSLPSDVSLVTAADMRGLYGIDLGGFAVDVLGAGREPERIRFGSERYLVEPIHIGGSHDPVLSDCRSYREASEADRDASLVVQDGTRFVGAVWSGEGGRRATWVWPARAPTLAMVRLSGGEVEAAVFVWRASEWTSARAATVRVWTDGGAETSPVEVALENFHVRASADNRDLTVVDEGMQTAPAQGLSTVVFLLFLCVPLVGDRQLLRGTLAVATIIALFVLILGRQSPAFFTDIPWDARRPAQLLEIGGLLTVSYALGVVLAAVVERRHGTRYGSRPGP